MLTYADEMFVPIREFVPPDVQKIMDDQIPKIKQVISTQIDQFAGQLGQYMAQTVADIVKNQQQQVHDAEASMQTAIQKLKDKVEKDPGKIDEAAQALSTAVQEYKDKWIGLGKTVQQAAVTGLRAAGIPIPAGVIPS